MSYEWELAGPQDSRVCAELVLQTEIGRFFTDAEGFFTRAEEESALYVSRNSEGVVVALLKLSAHGGFHRYPYIHVYAVHPHFQGQGVGSRLLAAFEANVLAPAEKVFLLVADFNVRAQAFYAKCGYEKVGEVSDFFTEGDTEWIMMKRLTSEAS